MTPSTIISSSGNSLFRAYEKKLITWQEYRENVELLYVEEFETQEEALDREAELIQRAKEIYGNRCLNKYLGNKYGALGVHINLGVPFTSEHKKKISNARKEPISQFDLNGKFIRDYLSAMDAAEDLGISRFSIYKCLTGRSKSSGGYIWRKQYEI